MGGGGGALVNVASVAQRRVPAGTEDSVPLGPDVKYTAEKVTFHGSTEPGPRSRLLGELAFRRSVCKHK